MRREQKPVPNDEVLKRAHEHDHVHDVARDQASAPIVVDRDRDRDRDSHRDIHDDPAHPHLHGDPVHAHGSHVHTHPHGEVPHTHATHAAPATPVGPSREDRDVLFPTEETTGYRSRWEAIQTGFVDEPRAAVEQADALVGQITSRLSEVFTRERQALEHQWGRGDNVSTEELRLALKRYRAFFDRLLSL